jgi:hypothetical protein
VGREHRGIWKALVAASGVAALSALLVNGIRSSGPSAIDAAELSGWTIVTGRDGEPGVVALQPPVHLTGNLFQDLLVRVGQPLMAPSRTVMPLVLQTEYEDSLQGVLSVDDVVRLARESGVDTARFEPICVGHRHRASERASGRLFFVVFDSPAFADFRQRLLPLHTEHGGVSVYDPGALRPILAVAATDRAFDRWWPITVERSDCLFGVESR